MPIPASPRTRTCRELPARALCHSASRRASSRGRPTKGIMALARGEERSAPRRDNTPRRVGGFSGDLRLSPPPAHRERLFHASSAEGGENHVRYRRSSRSGASHLARGARAGDRPARPPRPGRAAAWVAADGRVGLGHARLSIIDLATGDQPIASEDEPLRIVVNGEFYDFERDPQRDLERRGHRFRTRSDSEIALHLYEDLGAACLHAAARRVRLRPLGRAATTRSSPRATASASSRSTTPCTAARCYLASEVKALLAAGRARRAGTATTFFAASPLLTALRPDRTLFEGIYQVPPGHYLLATGGQRPAGPLLGLRLPARPSDARPPATDAEYAERFARGAGRGGAAAAARRRAGRLLPQRRASTRAPCSGWRAPPRASRSGPSR